MSDEKMRSRKTLAKMGARSHAFMTVSATYVEGASPAKVRLTWERQPDGMSIIVR